MTKENQFVLHINAVGELLFVYADELAALLDLGDAVIARASHVEPQNGSAGAVWRADMRPSGGPVLGEFRLRSEALEAEREWLEENLV